MFSTAGEDLWHTYNLVREGDLVTSTTFRKVQVGMNAESERVKIKLQVKVEVLDYDAEGEAGSQAHLTGSS